MFSCKFNVKCLQHLYILHQCFQCQASGLERPRMWETFSEFSFESCKIHLLNQKCKSCYKHTVSLTFQNSVAVGLGLAVYATSHCFQSTKQCPFHGAGTLYWWASHYQRRDTNQVGKRNTSSGLTVSELQVRGLGHGCFVLRTVQDM